MPAAKSLTERISSRKVLTFIGAFAGTALAILTLQTEISFRLDSWIVTEAEAADFAEQQQINRLEDKVITLNLQLKHAESPAQTNSLNAQLIRTERQLSYILCVTDPGMNPDHCIP